MWSVLVVILLVTAAILMSIVCMCGPSWLMVHHDNRLIATVSPWQVCAVGQASFNKTVPPMVCFTMTGWTGTGFGPLEVVQQLEYWSIGAQVLSLLITLVLTCQRSFYRCSLWLRKPALVLLVLSTVLSIGSLSLFPAWGRSGLKELTGFQERGDLIWTYWLRLVATMITGVSFVAGYWCLKPGRPVPEVISEETQTFVASEQDDSASDQQPMIQGSGL